MRCPGCGMYISLNMTWCECCLGRKESLVPIDDWASRAIFESRTDNGATNSPYLKILCKDGIDAYFLVKQSGVGGRVEENHAVWGGGCAGRVMREYLKAPVELCDIFDDLHQEAMKRTGSTASLWPLFIFEWLKYKEGVR